MTCKKEITSFSESKILNYYYIRKNIRNTINLQKNVLITDNNSQIEKTITHSAHKIGFPLDNYKTEVIVNNFNKSIKIYNSLGFKLMKTKYIAKHILNIKNIIKKKNRNNLIIPTKTNNKRVSIISLGIQGFTPQKHIGNTTKNIVKKTIFNTKSFPINLVKKFSRFLPVRIPLAVKSLPMYPNARINKFSKNKNIKSYTMNKNVLFIAKQYSNNLNENKKKNRKHKNELSNKE